MNADKGWKVRKACLTAIRQCEQAEQKARHAQQGATRQRQTDLKNARQKHAQSRQQAEALLRDTRSLAQEGERILTDLELAPGPPKLVTPPAGASLDELGRLLHNRRNQARETLSRLKTVASELKDERRKWWKFW